MAGDMLARFFDWNRKLCRSLERRISGKSLTFSEEYNQLCARMVNSRPGAVVLDVGTGKHLWYGDLLDLQDCFLIGCDIAADEIAINQTIHQALVCDASERIAIEDASVDLVTSHYCIEHLPDVAQFVRECARVLKPGGSVCFIYAGPNSLHALFNRVMPNSIARRLLYFFIPSTRETGGFKAHYDHGRYSQFADLLHRNGFSIQRSWRQFGSRDYLGFFLPFYLVALVLDLLWQLTGNKDWAAHYLWIATKESKSVAAPQDHESKLRFGI